MAGERVDYTSERQRHETFIGRDELLRRLDRLLVTDQGDRAVLLTGAPGRGKSAILARWLSERERAGEPQPHHFIRRGEHDWDDPVRLVGSLIWQLEQRFPGLREPDADAVLPPPARLEAMLARVSAAELAPGGRRLTLVIDGLDEQDPPSGASAPDPLAAFLPATLPPGVSFLCASAPGRATAAALEARGEVVRIDLDDPAHADDNRATVRAFWVEAARPLGLGSIFIQEAVARADGNLQHATMLRKYLASLPAAQRRVKSVPGGLDALVAKLWERVIADPAAVQGFGLLCAAREALTLEELAVAAEWGDDARRRFGWCARELLAETWRPDGPREYRLNHETIRAHISTALGLAALRVHHGTLARRLAAWPAPEAPALRRYALRHGLAHRAAAGDWIDAWRLASDASFLEARRRELGVVGAAADLSRIARRARAAGNVSLAGRLDELVRTQAPGDT